jgi:anti-anti-sigma factor
MTVDVVRDGQVTHLKLRGRLDLDSSGVIKGEVRRCLAQGELRLLLDLTAVEFINSSGLGTLVSVLKEVRLARGRLVLCNLARYVREIFEITQLARVFELAATEQEGCAALVAAKVEASP